MPALCNKARVGYAIIGMGSVGISPMNIISRMIIALFCLAVLVTGLLAKARAYPPDTHWEVKPLYQSGDTTWVSVTLYPQYCWGSDCPEPQHSKLVVTPCPFDVPCFGGSFVLERQSDIYSAVTQLKLSMREKYEFSGDFYHLTYFHATGVPCGAEGCKEEGSVVVKTFPDDSSINVDGYIGLFTGDIISNSCVTAEGDFFPFEMWIWCKPSSSGLELAAFRILYPSNAIPGAVTQNDDIVAISIGSLEDGVGVLYSACQYNWNWSYHQTVYVTSHSASTVLVAPHPDVGSIEFQNCRGRRDVVWIRTPLYLNSCESTATKKSNWGSIKSLFGK